MARIKAAALLAEKRLAARKAGKTWANQAASRGSLKIGPFKVPSNEAELTALANALSVKPETATALFILTMLFRRSSRKMGNKMIANVLHPNCLIKATEDAVTGIRKHTLRELHKFSDATDGFVLPSYVAGATPDNGYDYDTETVQHSI